MSLRRRGPHGRLEYLSRQSLVSCGTRRLMAGPKPAIILVRSGLVANVSPHHFQQHVTVARQRRAPAYQILASQLRQRSNDVRLGRRPLCVFGDHLGSYAIASDNERIAEDIGSADIASVRSGL